MRVFPFSGHSYQRESLSDCLPRHDSIQITREYDMFFSCVCRFVPCFALCSALSIAGLAHAHSVYIYAWPEHGGICTESYYSTEEKVRAGKVEMMTAAGESLQIVQSDQEGRACFRAPDKVRGAQVCRRCRRGAPCPVHNVGGRGAGRPAQFAAGWSGKAWHGCREGDPNARKAGAHGSAG